MSKSIEVLETIKSAALVDELQQSEDGVRVAVAMGLVKSAETVVRGTPVRQQSARARADVRFNRSPIGAAARTALPAKPLAPSAPAATMINAPLKKTGALAKPKVVTTSPQVPPVKKQPSFNIGRLAVTGK